MDDRVIFETPGDLDLPGETSRQGRVFVTWALCLLLAVIGGSIVRARVAMEDEGSLRAERELARARVDKAKVAFGLGVLLPALLTFGLNRRHRRGGAHARGIMVDVTRDDELRMWGRGYGTRVALEGAEVKERLVDVYAGRLGAWRQRRLRVRGVARLGGREIEIATPARRSDTELGLTLEGGEGDCIEVPREAYERIVALVSKEPPKETPRVV